MMIMLFGVICQIILFAGCSKDASCERPDAGSDDIIKDNEKNEPAEEDPFNPPEVGSGERREAGLDGVVVGFAADERDHLVGLAGNGGFYRGLAGEEGFVVVRLRGAMRGGPLRHAEGDEAGLGARQVLIDEALQDWLKTHKPA